MLGGGIISFLQRIWVNHGYTDRLKAWRGIMAVLRRELVATKQKAEQTLAEANRLSSHVVVDNALKRIAALGALELHATDDIGL